MMTSIGAEQVIDYTRQDFVDGETIWPDPNDQIRQ